MFFCKRKNMVVHNGAEVGVMVLVTTYQSKHLEKVKC